LYAPSRHTIRRNVLHRPSVVDPFRAQGEGKVTTSIKALLRALVERGHDVTRTPINWIAPDASDEAQLLTATAQGRCIFTFNVRDFVVLARSYPRHGGIVLAAQASWTLSELVTALDRLLSELETEEWTGQVRCLNDWRE
jgi:hypothetical protein